jgi:hypothetical protein
LTASAARLPPVIAIMGNYIFSRRIFFPKNIWQYFGGVNVKVKSKKGKFIPVLK